MVFLLVDFRHKPTEDDILMYQYLKYYHRPVTVIATKADKVKQSQRKKNKEIIRETLQLSMEDRLIVTSSMTKEGLDLVLSVLDAVV